MPMVRIVLMMTMIITSMPLMVLPVLMVFMMMMTMMIVTTMLTPMVAFLETQNPVIALGATLRSHDPNVRETIARVRRRTS